MAKQTTHKVDGVVYLRDRSDDGRERYAGSASTVAIEGPSAPVGVAPRLAADGEDATAPDFDAFVDDTAVVGKPVPMRQALAMRFAGDEVEAEFHLPSGQIVSGTRNDVREFVLSETDADMVTFADESGERFTVITAEGSHQVDIVSAGPIIACTDDVEGIDMAQRILEIEGDVDTEAANAAHTLERLLVNGEVGEHDLVAAVSYLGQVCQDLEDGYCYGAWEQPAHQGEAARALIALETGVPVTTVERAAWEHYGREPHDVHRMLTDGEHPLLP